MKRSINIVYLLLLVFAILFVLLGIYFKTTGRADMMYVAGSLAIAFFIGCIILKIQVKFFPNSFNNKPTREELEKKMFGK
jgi:hypothetical protein